MNDLVKNHKYIKASNISPPYHLPNAPKVSVRMSTAHQLNHNNCDAIKPAGESELLLSSPKYLKAFHSLPTCMQNAIKRLC